MPTAREVFNESAPLSYEALQILAGTDDIGMSRAEYDEIAAVQNRNCPAAQLPPTRRSLNARAGSDGA